MQISFLNKDVLKGLFFVKCYRYHVSHNMLLITFTYFCNAGEWMLWELTLRLRFVTKACFSFGAKQAQGHTSSPLRLLPRIDWRRGLLL